MSSTLPEEFTPEQRRLLARAYRLILSWPRDEQRKSQPQAPAVGAGQSSTTEPRITKVVPAPKHGGGRNV